MLSNPKEIEIIAKARQKNVRDASRSRQHFDTIYADFFVRRISMVRHLSTLAPGSMISAYWRASGVQQWWALTMTLRYWRSVIIRASQLGKFIFSTCVRETLKNRSTACFVSSRSIRSGFGRMTRRSGDLLTKLFSLIRPDGWAWIAPWSGVPKNENLSAEEMDRILSMQTQEFAALGFDVFELTCELSKEYGVHGTTTNRALFLRNLPIPKRRSGYRVDRRL